MTEIINGVETDGGVSKKGGDDRVIAAVPPATALDTLLGVVKLDWIRPLVYRFGGRKMVMGGGGMAIIKLIIGDGSDLTWPKAVACLSVAVVAVGGMFAVAHEDRGKR